MRVVLGVAAALALLACGPAGGTVTPPEDGTVKGRVLLYPCAPVERVGSPCPGRPASGVEVDLVARSDGHVARTKTNADGTYSVRLAPGTYSIQVLDRRPILRGEPTVVVQAGVTVTNDLVIDSGIR